MKTSILISAIAACTLSAPIASAQDKHTHDKPAMNMGMGKHMSQMQEHMQAMQENMEAMRGMGGPMMLGGGEHGGMMMGGKKDGDMMKRHEMMEKRMDMVHMIMEQMMQHDQMTQSMPAK